jgi:hypothetical protein
MYSSESIGELVRALFRYGEAAEKFLTVKEK